MKWMFPVMAAFMVFPVRADDVSSAIDDAKSKYESNHLAASVKALESALSALHLKLGTEFLGTFPDIQGWRAETPEVQGLAQVGGGLSVRQAFVREAGAGAENNQSPWLGMVILVDSPAVEAATALMSNIKALAAQPHMSQVDVNGMPALLRYDAEAGNGEIILVLKDRVLLEIEGNRLSDANILIEAAKQWKFDKINSLINL